MYLDEVKKKSDQNYWDGRAEGRAYFEGGRNVDRRRTVHNRVDPKTFRRLG